MPVQTAVCTECRANAPLQFVRRLQSLKPVCSEGRDSSRQLSLVVKNGVRIRIGYRVSFALGLLFCFCRL